MDVAVESAKDLFTRFHPNSLKFVRPTAKYVTATRREMVIAQRPGGQWYIHFYRGTELPYCLKGNYTSFRECEKALIQYLRSKDKWNKAIWPGKYDKSNNQ